MRLTADQELRREFLLFSLSKQPDVEAAIEMAALMEWFVLNGQPERGTGKLENVASATQNGQGQLHSSIMGSASESSQATDAKGDAKLSDQSESVLRKRRWSEADDQDFVRLWQSDRSLEEIAEKLDRTVPSLYSRARAMGLARRNLKPGGAPDKAESAVAKKKKGKQGAPDGSGPSQGKGQTASSLVAVQKAEAPACDQQTIKCERYQDSAPGKSGAQHANRSRKGVKRSAKSVVIGGADVGTTNSVRADYFVEPVIQFLRSRDYSVIRVGDGQFQLDGRTVLNADELRRKANQLRKSLGQPPFASHLEEPAT